MSLICLNKLLSLLVYSKWLWNAHHISDPINDISNFVWYIKFHVHWLLQFSNFLNWLFLEKDKNAAEFNTYKAWIKERKKLRGDLNQCGMICDWLQNKPSLTEIEQKVQDMQFPVSKTRPMTRRKSMVTMYLKC